MSVINLNEVDFLFIRDSNKDEHQAKLSYWTCAITYKNQEGIIKFLYPYRKGLFPSVTDFLEKISSDEKGKEIIKRLFGQNPKFIQPDIRKKAVLNQSYSFDGLSLNQLKDFCYQQSVEADSILRRYAGNEHVVKAARKWSISSFNAYRSWINLRDSLKEQDLQQAAKDEELAVGNHQQMVKFKKQFHDALPIDE